MACYNPKHGMQSPYGGRILIYPIWEHRKPSINRLTGEVCEEFIVKCGKCIGCLMDRSREWACRITMESLSFRDNYFLTLTYDDEHCPRGADPFIWSDVKERYILRDGAFWVEDKEKVYHREDGTVYYGGDYHGEFENIGILSIDDYKNFMKRLRINLKRHYGFDEQLRMYGCGEYGSKSWRPHYHFCLMNLPLDDLYVVCKNKLGMPLYSSSFIEETWGNGMVALAPLNWQNAAYTARYVQKKADISPMIYEKIGIPKEFQTMSRRPGLGRYWFDEHCNEIYETDQVVLPAMSKDKPSTFRPPKYFDALMKERDPYRMAEIKSQRAEVARIMEQNRSTQTDLDVLQYFEVAKAAASSRFARLSRYL